MPATHFFERAASPRRLAAGFTLIELMITVAIIGILSAIAYPAYTSSVFKGRRGEGRAALADLMQQQERYLTQTGCYGVKTANGCATFISTTPNLPFKTFSGNTAPTSAYLLNATACPAQALTDCVQLNAVPVINDPQAGTLWMQSTGQKGCSVVNSSVCWK